MAPIPPDGGDDSGKVKVTPDDINSSATTFSQQQEALDQAWSKLSDALQGNQGMAGNDGGAEKFSSHYDPAAQAAWKAFGAGIRTLGGIATGLVTTANNYLKADAHSTAGGASPQQYPPPGVYSDVIMPDVPSAKGPGKSGVPDFLAQYWPNGDSDKLRAAAGAWRAAQSSLGDIVSKLHTAVEGMTAVNDSECVRAMNDLWDSLAKDGDNSALFTGLQNACGKLAAACDQYAKAIDDAQSNLEDALAGAGIAVGLTTVVGILLTPFTFGGSDAAAGAADAAEVAAICEPIAEEFATTVATEMETTIAADVATELEVVADAAPDIEAVEADTTDVDSAVDDELNKAEGDSPKPEEPPAEPGQEVDKFEAKNFRNDQTAQRHFRDHGADFGSQSVEDYEQGAENFLKDAQEKGYPARVDANGRIRVYDPATNTFGVYDSDGSIVSYYKPSSSTYWDRNSPGWGDPVKWK